MGRIEKHGRRNKAIDATKEYLKHRPEATTSELSAFNTGFRTGWNAAFAKAKRYSAASGSKLIRPPRQKKEKMEGKE